MGAFFGVLAQLREEENLETAAVGQDRPIPIHETMKPAKFPDHLESWPNEQMISVPENNLRLELDQLAGADRFHAALRPDRHVGGRLDHAVRSFQATSARSCVPIGRRQLKHW